MTLTNLKVDDGWHGELRWYLRMMFNVDKRVDVIKWWQVRYFFFSPRVGNSDYPRTMYMISLLSQGSHLITSQSQGHQFLASGYFRWANSL